MFCSRRGKRTRVTLNVFSPLLLSYQFFSFCLWALFHGFSDILVYAVTWSDLWHCIPILLTWITLSIHAFSKGEIFGFVPNLVGGNDMRQYLFDLRFRSFIWRFLCFLSSSWLLQQEFTQMESTLCACMWSLTRISIVAAAFLLTAHWLHSTLWWYGMQQLWFMANAMDGLYL